MLIQTIGDIPWPTWVITRSDSMRLFSLCSIGSTTRMCGSKWWPRYVQNLVVLRRSKYWTVFSPEAAIMHDLALDPTKSTQVPPTLVQGNNPHTRNQKLAEHLATEIFETWWPRFTRSIPFLKHQGPCNALDWTRFLQSSERSIGGAATLEGPWSHVPASAKLSREFTIVTDSVETATEDGLPQLYPTRLADHQSREEHDFTPGKPKRSALYKNIYILL